MTGKPDYPNVVIRASAGTGKTHQLAVRFIGLLAAGAHPAEILASTFTRKAAGEIADRVLVRLAQSATDEDARQKLSQWIGRPLNQSRCEELLLTMLQNLHRLQVGTLDSYFIQVGGSFAQELGLPPGWTICEELDDQALREEAIEHLLAQGRLSDLVTLVHSLSKGATARSIAQLVQSTISGLLELYREAPAVAWEQLKPGKPLLDEQLEPAIAALAAYETTHKRIHTACQQDASAARSRDWMLFIGRGCAKALVYDAPFYGKPVPAEVAALYAPLLQHAKAELVGLVARQTEATRDLLQRFAVHYDALQFDERMLRFADVTTRLAAAATALDGEHLAFRLDGAVRHVLLDEFQDTAPAQWQVLRPLAQRVTSSGGGSFFCVGDAKQAIYGWRGGVAEIFDALEGELSGLATEQLVASYRSSPPVIDAVNQVFQNLMRHSDLDHLAEAVTAWQARFPTHTTTRGELPGYVALEVAPPAAEGQSPARNLFQRAAARIQEIRNQAPEATIGVLVRTNGAVAQLIYELRERGIEASEEGGNPLVDSPAVELLLSLLKLADHPGDTVARFHVAHSPLAAATGLANYRDAAAALRVGSALRRQLLAEGYGKTIQAWATRLAPDCDARDQGRLSQLVELAFDYQRQSTLRTDDFRQLVESQRIADPTSSAVRVMTVHQSKGLQFDVVVLPELEKALVGQSDLFAAGRPGPTQPVSVICRHADECVRQFFPPELQKLFEGERNREVSESLCLLYVALTRAIHSLVMVVAPPKPSEKKLPKTFAGLLRAALSPGAGAPAGHTVYEHGDRNWHRSLPSNTRAVPAAAEQVAAEPPAVVLAAPLPSRPRGLERTSPSALEGGHKCKAASILGASPQAAFQIGTLVHGWCEQIEWLDSGPPSDSLLDQVAARLAGNLGIAAADLPVRKRRFREQLLTPAIVQVLSRSFYDQPANLGLARLQEASWSQSVELEVCREMPFALRDGDRLLSGAFDRLVVVRSHGRPIAADIIDFKSDELMPDGPAALRSKVEFYRPQIDSYRRAAASILGLEAANVSARLVFLSAGIVAAVID